MNPAQLERQESRRIIKQYWTGPLNSKGINFAALSKMKIRDIKKMQEEIEK